MYGTREELAEKLGVKKETINFYASQAHKRRIANSKNAIIAIKLDEDEEV